ncbi:ATP-binding cassette domain-containing protein [Pseudothermotoga sp. U03pept]|uniref:ATP-binding cassette domain-containing protein n=1 Tax=Pseudothermotoga sp. U03pept TaxID=3447012 RepID=UPI003F02A06B
MTQNDQTTQSPVNPIENRSSVEFYDFSMSIDGVSVLKNIDLVVKAGELTIVYGPRGAGKSALLRSLLRLNREIYDNVDWSGELRVNGKSITMYDKKTLRRLITYIEPSFVEALDHLRFREFINLVLSERPVSLDEFSSELDRLGILKLLRREMQTPLREFYTMEKIMILLFAAIVRKSSIIVLDCILDHVDDETLVPVIKELSNLREDRVVILSTRHKNRFLPLADIFVAMKDGKIEYKGAPRELILKR